MAFLDGVKGKISMASYSTVQKAKDMSELTRLNMAISESETKIKELYSEIGYKVYSAYKEEPLEAVKDEIGQVNDLHQAIEVCKLQIKSINAMNSCPNCGEKIKPTMIFCSNCGYRLQEERKEEEKVKKRFCTGCGKPLDPGVSFCTECGKPVEE